MSKSPYSDRPVGYGKPPKEWQYKKGQSGNPKGRPKEKSNNATDISELLNGSVKMKINGKTRNISAFEADVRKITRNNATLHVWTPRFMQAFFSG